VARVTVRRVSERGAMEASDVVALEAPLELRIAGRPFTVLMRTPGDDEELVRGFLLTEGIATGPEDIVRLVRVDENVLEVELVPALAGALEGRGLYSSSACGACGRRSLESLRVASGTLDEPFRVRASVLGALPERLRAAQPTFGQSGGVHGCALFDAEGRLEALREDVGRHNAVDKVIGWALGSGKIPLRSRVMLLSGRIAFELVEKAVVAGVPVLAAVGAPTSLALEVAREHGLTVVGFVRPGSLNVYVGAERVAP
jgi:FdhD protein